MAERQIPTACQIVSSAAEIQVAVSVNSHTSGSASACKLMTYERPPIAKPTTKPPRVPFSQYDTGSESSPRQCRAIKLRDRGCGSGGGSADDACGTSSGSDGALPPAPGTGAAGAIPMTAFSLSRRSPRG